MYANKKYLCLAATVCAVTALMIPESERSSVIAFASGLYSAALILFAMAGFMVQEDYFPRLGPGVFEHKMDYDEWRKYAQSNDEYSKVVWWAFNLPPEQWLHFVQLINELRYTCDQQGMKSLSNYFRDRT